LVSGGLLLIGVVLGGCIGGAEMPEGGSAAKSPTAGTILLGAAPTQSASVATTMPASTGAQATSSAGAPTPSTTEAQWSTEPYPLQIEVMRQQDYSASAITVEQTLEPGPNYSRNLVSYRSDGYLICALMTIPDGSRPAAGWPGIVFNHGYVDPAVYRPTTRYVDYVNAIARSGYVVFMPDCRGWGDSEGDMVVGGGYGAPDLTRDVLNALASVKAHPEIDSNRICMWGHSLGGQLTLRSMVVTDDVKAGAIWGGVVAPYPDVIARWGRIGRGRYATPEAQTSRPTNYAAAWIQSFGTWVQDFQSEYGTPEQNPDYWATISPNAYLDDLSGPIALHHSTTDEMVPLAWTETLARQLEEVNAQPYEMHTYAGDNHNISANFGVAMPRTVAFIDQYVKGQP
jgi:dienelactone hydrolase